MNNRLRFIFLLSVLSSLSCKKVITLNLHNAATQVVITGEITDSAGPYQVVISSTVNFSANNTFPPVSGAVVIITDNNGLLDSLSETTPGIYTTHNNWTGQPGNSYTLKVTSSGKTYTAVSTMPYPVPLDSIGFTVFSTGNNGNVINAIPYFQDPPGMPNYYQFTETINAVPLTDEIFVFSDRLSEGKYISQPLFDDSVHLHLGDLLSLSMYSIDKNVYQYFYELQQLLQANPFNEATPSNPDTNLTGGALGYFSAHTIETKQKIVGM
jgi:hypothetical protein